MSRRRVYTKHRTAHHAEPVHGSSPNGAEHMESPQPDGGALQMTHTDGQHADGDNAESAGFVSRLLYTASYNLAYGIVFPVMFIAYSVPTENALVHGLIDGGRAARDAVAALHDHSGSPEPAAAAEGAPA